MSESTYSIIAYHGSQLPEQYSGFIFSKWLRSLRYGNDLFRLIDQRAYYSSYRNYVQKILSDEKTHVRLAVLSDDRDVALGFAVHRDSILDYCYVHKDHRKTRIAAHLIPQGITTFTHITKTVLPIWGGNPKYKEWKFNPFT